jgi:aminoglycoside phosphotransferase (APT) family kinase protein
VAARARRAVLTTGAYPRHPRSRGGPLAEGDEQVRRSVAELGDGIDGDAALHSWEESLDAPARHGPDVWVHGDLLLGNLLVVDGRLSAVIDLGALNVGDPACDLLPRGTSSPAGVASGSGSRTSAAELPDGEAAAYDQGLFGRGCSSPSR